MMERTKEVRASSSGRRAWRVVVAAALLLSALGGGSLARSEETAKIDLNTASAAELESLPGVGPSKAQAIVAHREVAPFKNADELVEVKGIGEKLYAQLKDRVTVSSAGGAAAKKGAADAGAPASADGKGGRAAAAGGTR